MFTITLLSIITVTLTRWRRDGDLASSGECNSLLGSSSSSGGVGGGGNVIHLYSARIARLPI